MRYFLLGYVLVAALVVSIAGIRGSTSRKPPLYIFPDMDIQLKLRPQSTFDFFADGRSSRLPVPGTIARGTPFEDTPVHTGRTTGATNFVELNPLAATRELLLRGQQRFQIFCSPCHGSGGDGKGITSRYGMVLVANLHEARIVAQPDGEIFNTITHGKNLMGPYGANIVEEDRWAIIAYLRALHRSRLATLEDVPEPMRPSFTR